MKFYCLSVYSLHFFSHLPIRWMYKLVKEGCCLAIAASCVGGRGGCISRFLSPLPIFSFIYTPPPLQAHQTMIVAPATVSTDWEPQVPRVVAAKTTISAPLGQRLTMTPARQLAKVTHWTILFFLFFLKKLYFSCLVTVFVSNSARVSELRNRSLFSQNCLH